MNNKMNSKKETINFIIPCYKSANTIRIVVEGIIASIKAWYDYRIILVNDCSPDNVFDVIAKLCNEDKNILGINLSRNFGQQSARMAAIPYIKGEYVVFMDDDGQHPAHEIPKLIDALKDGHDIAYALFKHKKANWFKKFGSWVNKKMADLLIDKPKDTNPSSFFAMKSFVAEALINYSSPFPYLFGYFMNVTQNITSVEIEHLPRIEGRSTYTFGKLLRLWLNGFTSFSVVPLRAASFVGMLCAVLGFIWGGIVVIRKLVIPDIAIGYSSMMSIILFIGGMIMIMLGLLGEYIGRMFITMNHIPQYIIKDSINCEKRIMR